MKTSDSRLLQDPIESLRDDISSIRKDIAAIMGGGIESATQHTSAAIGRVSHAVKDVAERTRETAGELHQKLSDTAGTRPLATIALAALAGAIIAKLVDRLFR